MRFFGLKIKCPSLSLKALSFFGAGLILIYLFLMTAGFWVLNPPVNYFDLQAEAFLSGHTYLRMKPDPQLVAAYESKDYKRIPLNTPMLWDASLYKGQYYLYWGPTPALLCMVGKALHLEPLCDGRVMALMFGVGILIFFGLSIDRLGKIYSENPNRWLQWFLVMTFAFSSVQLYMIARPEVYHTAIMAGAFFVMGAFYFLFRYLVDPQGESVFFLNIGLWLTLAISSRITAIFYAFWIALAIVCLNWRRKKGEPWLLIKRLLFLLTPMVIGGMALMYYNWVRFDNPFELGTSYVVTNPEIRRFIDTGQVFRLSNIPQNIWYYILSIPNAISSFPFFQLDRNTSIFFTMPILFAFLLLNPAIRNKGFPAFKAFALSAGMGATTVFIYLMTYMGKNRRYEYDFIPFLFLLAYIGLARVEEGCSRSRRLRFTLGIALCLIGIWSISLGAISGLTALASRYPPVLLLDYWKNRWQLIADSKSYIPINLGEMSGYPPDQQAEANRQYRQSKIFAMAWEGTCSSQPILLAPGSYEVWAEHFGTLAENIPPMFLVQTTSNPVRVIPLQPSDVIKAQTKAQATKAYAFRIDRPSSLKVSVSYLNDRVESAFEDRNLYLTNLWFKLLSQNKSPTIFDIDLRELTGYPSELNRVAVEGVGRNGFFGMAWDGRVLTPPIPLPEGEFNLVLVHSGTPLQGEYPLFSVKILKISGDQAELLRKEQRYTSSSQIQLTQISPIHLPSPTNLRIEVAFLNDASSRTEDRNLNIHAIYFQKR